MATEVVERHGGRVPGRLEDLVRAAGRRPQDRQRGARARVRRAGAAGGPPRAARGEPHRHRRRGRPGGRRGAADRGASARALDRLVGHPDPARPPDLQAAAALRPVRRPALVRLLRGGMGRRDAESPDEDASRRRPGRLRPAGHGDECHADEARSVRTARRGVGAAHSTPLPRRDRERGARRRGRALAGAARGDGDRAARLPCSASTRARRSPSATGRTGTPCPTASPSIRVPSRTAATPTTRSATPSPRP